MDFDMRSQGKKNKAPSTQATRAGVSTVQSPLNTDENSSRFDKVFSDFVDKRFLGILSCSIVLHVMLVTYFLLNPISDEFELKGITQIQKELARTLKEREERKEEQFVQFDFKEKKPDGLAKGAPKKAGKAKSKQRASLKVPKKKVAKAVARSKATGKRAGGVRRTRRKSLSRSQIATNVAKKGVLAVLTSTAGAATGAEVADLLGEVNTTSGDLDKAMSQVSEIRGGRSGDGDRKKGGNVRGSRASGGGNINGVVSELGDVSSESFERSGELLVSPSGAFIEGGEGGSGIAGRRQEDIQAVILKHNKSVQHCYERELKRNPNLRGKITIRFTITAGGAVKKVELVSSTLGNRKVERCVIGRLGRWNDFGKIDASYGTTTIRQSYAFGY